MAKPRSGFSLNATIDPRARQAAENNADWYQMMAEVNGLRFERGQTGFAFRDPPPAYHSGMTITDPTATPDIAARRHPSTGVKDGFARLDLTGLGLRPAIHAQWIWANQIKASTDSWKCIEDQDSLSAWEAAWRAGGSPTAHTQFPAAILDRRDVEIWGLKDGSDFVSGGILNTSSDCVGLSNTFGLGALASLAACAAPLNLPLVGYEWDTDLDAALAAGFTQTGPLTIWFETSA